MSLTDNLRNLAELHEAGKLTDQEFTDGKKRLLERADDPTSNALPASAAVVPAPMKARSYRSSRWSSGNLFFPDKLTLAADGMLFRKGAMIGSNEEHISYRAVASYRVKNGLFLSDLCIETSGGSQPIFINGLWKSAAREIQETLRLRQNGA